MTGPPSRRRSRWPRALAALAGAAVGVLAAAPVVGASGLSGVSTGSDRVTLLGQSAWVRSGHAFHLHLGISAEDPGADSLAVVAYPQLLTRSAFDAAAAGDESGPPVWQTSQLPLSQLPADAAGGVDLAIPLDRAATGAELPEFLTGMQSAVYPLAVQLYGPTGPLGKPLTTFLVFDGDNAGLHRIWVSLVVPVATAPTVGRDGRVTPPSRSAAGALRDVVSTLGSSPVPVSLSVSPQTLEALRGGNRSDRDVVSRVADLVAGGDQLLPATYVPTSLGGLDAGGLSDQIDGQVSAATASLRTTLGSRPSASTWVVDGPLDNGALTALRSGGLSRLVVPANRLSALPSALESTTFGRPTPLRVPGASDVQVFGADTTLSGRVDGPGGPVLAAQQDLAELAMIQLETPGETGRGTAVLAPPDVSGAWLRVFLGGLRGNPFAAPVTVTGLFAHTTPLAGGQAPTRMLIGQSSPIQGAASLRGLAGRLAALGRLAPSASALLSQLQHRLLVAQASGLRPEAQAVVVAAGDRSITAVEHRLGLPVASSVTLTSRSATLPVTITSDPRLRAHVQLELASSTLFFRTAHPLDGRCTPGPSHLSETCDLRLQSAALTLRLPVETRTSGVFPLEVRLVSPGGGLVLAARRVTVRSTAVSFVGLVLMVAAALFLGAWWIHNARHGRRSRGLVPPPGDEPGDDGGGGPDDGPPPPAPEPGEAPVREPVSAARRVPLTVTARTRVSPSPALPGRNSWWAHGP